jgi:small basic protein
LCAALLAVVCLGLALLGIVPKMTSDCAEPLTAPFAAVAVCAALFAVFGTIAVRVDRWAAYLLVLSVPLVVLAQDWLMQGNLPSVLILACPSPLIR